MRTSGMVLLVSLILTITVSMSSAVSAQPTTASYTVKLSWYILQVSYPTEGAPGNTVTVKVQGSPQNSGVYLQTLTATVYYADANGLHAIATNSVVSNPANNYQSSGTGSFSKSFTVAIPTNATRTSLIAVFSETVQSNYYPMYYGYGPYSYQFFWGFQYAWYPSYYYGMTSTDSAIAPLTYIKATTPEYLTLRSEYQTLQQQLNQTQGRNQQLEATISQQTSTINALKEQLASTSGKAQAYQTLAFILGIVAIAFAVLNVATVLKQRKSTSSKKRPVPTKPTN